MEYSLVIKQLNEKLGIPNSHIFNFNGTPGEEEYLRLFNNANKELLRLSKYGLNPCFFYFADNSEINAYATKKNGTYAICMNKGLVEHFNRLFAYFNLNEYKELVKYQKIEKNLENKFGELIFQSTLLFTFFHELGHLIQFIDNPEVEINELLSPDITSIQSHSVELDADLYGALSLSAQFYKYFDKSFKGEKTEETVQQYISILTSSVFLYFLAFNEYRSGFFLKENSHPHPLVRMLSVITQVIQYFEHVLQIEGLTIKINSKIVIKETFYLAEIFTKKIYSHFDYQLFETLLSTKFKEIKEYFNELVAIAKSSPKSAINRRNKMASMNKHSK